MQVIVPSCAAEADVLSELYAKLKVGGGFFKGQRMSEEIAKKTRYELIAYITAVTNAVLISRTSTTINVQRVLAYLEQHVFSMQLVNARPVYEKYLARYRNKLPTDSSVLPRELVIHILFSQAILGLWSFSPSLSGGVGSSTEYSGTLIALSNRIEEVIRSAVDRTFPENPAAAVYQN